MLNLRYSDLCYLSFDVSGGHLNVLSGLLACPLALFLNFNNNVSDLQSQQVRTASV